MQKRVLDKRPSFNFSSVQNVSSNYYPVNSAIAMRKISKGSLTQVTVMNDRSQGGSAQLQNGTIELMHNRRLLKDDSRGVGEALNESDSDGQGMKVNTKYYLQIRDIKHQPSTQRQ